jgi:hypothetical protein
MHDVRWKAYLIVRSHSVIQYTSANSFLTSMINTRMGGALMWSLHNRVQLRRIDVTGACVYLGRRSRRIKLSKNLPQVPYVFFMRAHKDAATS